MRNSLMGVAVTDLDIATTARPEAVSELLEARAPRQARVPSAAACGLFLWRVWYAGGRAAVGGGSR